MAGFVYGKKQSKSPKFSQVLHPAFQDSLGILKVSSLPQVVKMGNCSFGQKRRGVKVLGATDFLFPVSTGNGSKIVGWALPLKAYVMHI